RVIGGGAKVKKLKAGIIGTKLILPILIKK
ncbi:hypothetical protein HKBW3S06_01172, partial [Candidatus Hakubella thermalkaliphila]